MNQVNRVIAVHTIGAGMVQFIIHEYHEKLELEKLKALPRKLCSMTIWQKVSYSDSLESAKT
jgi:hypothetical protein